MHSVLHDSNIPLEHRVSKALNWVREPDTCPEPVEGVASSKCFLIYRAQEGMLSSTEIDTVLNCKPDVKNPGLKARWEMSNTLAEAYLNLTRLDNIEEGVRLLRQVRKVWVGGAREMWPPQALNFLRARLLEIYYDHLQGKRTLSSIRNTIEEWTKHIYSLDWSRWPHRFTEARDDLWCLQALMFIARNEGYVEFGDKDWVNPEEQIRDKTSVFFQSLRRMNKHAKDPKLIVWHK